MNREEILKCAKICVCGDREQDYGSPENNFELIGELWASYLRKKTVKFERRNTSWKRSMRTSSTRARRTARS